MDHFQFQNVWAMYTEFLFGLYKSDPNVFFNIHNPNRLKIFRLCILDDYTYH